jgi:hypothetical protein
MVGADRGLSAAPWMPQGATHQPGTLLVAGKSPEGCLVPEGRKGKGHDVVHPPGWPWRASPWEARGRYARRTATRPTDGEVTVVSVAEPGQDRSDLCGQATSMSAPWLRRRWRRRHWIAPCCRPVQPLLAAEACQVHSADAYAGHWVWRLRGGFIVFSPSRVLCKGRRTMEEIVVSLKHSWRFVNADALEFQGLSWGTKANVA